MQVCQEIVRACSKPQEVETTAPDDYFTSLFGIEGHKSSSHNCQLYFSNGMWGITLQSLFFLFCGCEDHLIVFFHLITSTLCARRDSSPLYSSFSPLSLGPFPILKICLSFIHLSPIELTCIRAY